MRIESTSLAGVFGGGDLQSTTTTGTEVTLKFAWIDQRSALSNQQDGPELKVTADGDTWKSHRIE
jgi:hypothetical protein